MTTLSLCCQLFGFTFKFLNLFLQFNCNFYIRLGGISTLAGSTSSFYRIWFVSFTDHVQEVVSCLFGLLGPGSSTCGMGVYRGGQGAAFTTSMRLWHLQRQKFLPAQAQSFRCFPNQVTKTSYSGDIEMLWILTWFGATCWVSLFHLLGIQT